MEHMSSVMLIESQRQDREREVAQARRGQGEDRPSRPVAWRVYLVMAVILVGMIVWWIH
jgi:hypothetical protein